GVTPLRPLDQLRRDKLDGPVEALERLAERRIVAPLEFENRPRRLHARRYITARHVRPTGDAVEVLVGARQCLPDVRRHARPAERLGTFAAVVEDRAVLVRPALLDRRAVLGCEPATAEEADVFEGVRLQLVDRLLDRRSEE